MGFLNENSQLHDPLSFLIYRLLIKNAFFVRDYETNVVSGNLISLFPVEAKLSV